MHECFWIRGETQGIGGECEPKKSNLKLARNGQLFVLGRPLLLLYFNEAVASKELSLHVRNGYEVGAAA